MKHRGWMRVESGGTSRTSASINSHALTRLAMGREGAGNSAMRFWHGRGEAWLAPGDLAIHWGSFSWRAPGIPCTCIS
ncbi:MAG: hypothetical protein EBV45_16580, partial [Chloroflexi bacterium]|nr:hypothetical protein [Chloroflexota bacterium]